MAAEQSQLVVWQQSGQPSFGGHCSICSANEWPMKNAYGVFSGNARGSLRDPPEEILDGLDKSWMNGSLAMAAMDTVIKRRSGYMIGKLNLRETEQVTSSGFQPPLDARMSF